ncbi:kinase-like domain-containing protein [Melanogaster broomeanus]|nr:kinase-like domain-containing protein [Melanogaster broomeanus]
MDQVIRVDGRYWVGSKLGTGSYSVVYHSQDIFTGQQFAIKLEHCDNTGVSYLEDEYEILHELQDGTSTIPGLPRLIWLGREGIYHAMVMESLGPSLHNFFLQSSALSLPYVAKIGAQLVTHLEYVHSRNFIHRDVKPHNILMGVGDSRDTFFLIDFGIAQKYRDPSSCIHIPMQENLSLVSTPAFTSLNSHHGLQLGHRDDIESLAYSLIFLHHGSLPWLTGDGKSPLPSATFHHKQTFLAVASALGIPIVLTMILNHARSLAFMQKPDYSYLRTILENAASSTEAPSSLPVPDPYSPISMPHASSPKPNIFIPDSKMKSKIIEETSCQR